VQLFKKKRLSLFYEEENKVRKKILRSQWKNCFINGLYRYRHQSGYCRSGYQATIYQHFPTKMMICVCGLYLTRKQNSFEIFNYTKRKKSSREKILLSFDFITEQRSTKLQGMWLLNIISDRNSKNKSRGGSK